MERGGNRIGRGSLAERKMVSCELSSRCRRLVAGEMLHLSGEEQGGLCMRRSDVVRRKALHR